MRTVWWRSHECDFPPSVQALPICSEPRIDISAGSGEIDRQVKAALRDALSIYTVFREELERLKPSVIITQSQCDVCAVNLEDVQAAVCEMVESKPKIVSLEPMALSDIWSDIQNVAAALNDVEAGHRLIDSLQKRLQNLA